jgi:hypothetical protein
LPRFEETGGQYAAAAAERRAPRRQVNAAFVVEIVVESVDAGVRQDQAEAGQQGVPQVERAVIPGDARAEEGEHHGQNQELGSGLEEPYF